MDKMKLSEQLTTRKTKLAVVGLGYVGMPLAAAFDKKADVIGYDVNEETLEKYRSGIDPTNEIGDEAVREMSVDFTSDPARLREASMIIVAVPTPVNDDHTPDLTLVREACRTVGENLSPGTTVVFESTVYPGVTREICKPIIEKASGLKCGRDWELGYSPERINPGDKKHRLENIEKIVSGFDATALDSIADVYSLIIRAGVHRAESIEVAEAAKITENSQRDINIAFMNELSVMFHRMNIDTKAVLEAAGTKWNFLKFTPGLVGGHCIGIDPYYLTYRTEQYGYHSRIILAGRQINDDMGKYVGRQFIKLLIRREIPIHHARVALFGITFKENCPDVRNSKVIDIIRELQGYLVDPIVVDPVADREEARKQYGIELGRMEDVTDMDAIIIAVPHQEFAMLSAEDLSALYRPDDSSKILVDVKGLYHKEDFPEPQWEYWRL